LTLSPSNENLRQAKTKLDEYIIALSKIVEDKNLGIITDKKTG
jgi:hypothetical protein